MKTYLIVGGAGFIGCHFTTLVESKYTNDRFVVLDSINQTSNEIPNSVIYEPITDRFDKSEFVKLFEKYKFNIVVDIQNKIDIYNCYNLLDCCHKYNIDRFIYTAVNDPFDSQTEINQKSAAEQLVLSSYDKFNTPAIVIKSSNNFGTGQSKEKFIPNTILKAVQQDFVSVPYNGKTVRDWISIVDTCRAIDVIMNFGICGEIYNIKSNYKIEDVELVKRILKYFKLPLSLIEYTDNMAKYIEDEEDDKVLKLGWSPKIDFDDGLIETIKSYQANFEKELQND